MRVATSTGWLQGAASNGVIRFRGVPYSTARRFSAPEPTPAWNGVLDATRHGPQCPQLLGPLEQMLGGSSIPQAEDCLTLSVTTPACDERRRPVIVWVHGGAFVTGTGAMPWYHGGALARRGDVVVVSINYRLGVLGFLGRTNAGLADQIAALRWVHDEITAFGGDPDNVTVLGESAGGASVLALLAAPAADGLVHRAWAMSPSIGQFRDATRADQVLLTILSAAGCADQDELLACSVEQLLEAQAVVLADRSAGFDGFSPTHGTDLLPVPVTEAVATNPVPLVLGTTRDEMHLFVLFDPQLASLDEVGLAAQVEERLPGRSQEIVSLYRAHRPGASPTQILSAVLTDQTFRGPAQRVARARADSGVPTWSTWFTWPSSGFGGALGACHGLDIPFAFDNLHQPGVDRFTGVGAERQAVATAHSDALLHFARTGSAPWDPVSAPGTPTLRIDEVTEQVDDPEPELRQLWASPSGLR
jgi:para-nitrobenzyl esterase